MLLKYLNYAAMAIGYIVLSVLLLLAVLLVYLSLKDRHNKWKLSREEKMEKQEKKNPDSQKPHNAETSNK